MDHEKINYLEFPAKDLVATKQFFEKVFSWRFESFGEEYLAFYDAGIEGGFYLSDQCSRSDNGSALTVFFSSDLEASLEKVKGHKGEIIKDIFSFPGGRRFHFLEPSGNEFAIWSDK